MQTTQETAPSLPTLTVPDDYVWRVTMRDGTAITEYDLERADGRGFMEIGDIKEVVKLELVPCIPFDDVIHSVVIPRGATPIFFRRRRISFEPSNIGGQQHSTTAHCIGWNRGNDAVYLFVLNGGSTVLTDDLQAV